MVRIISGLAGSGGCSSGGRHELPTAVGRFAIGVSMAVRWRQMGHEVLTINRLQLRPK